MHTFLLAKIMLAVNFLNFPSTWPLIHKVNFRHWTQILHRRPFGLATVSLQIMLILWLLPETAAWQGDETKHCQKHPEGKQGEDIQEGVHAQEKAKDHQLEKSHSNTSKSNNDCQTDTSKLNSHQWDSLNLYILSSYFKE